MGEIWSGTLLQARLQLQCPACCCQSTEGLLDVMLARMLQLVLLGVAGTSGKQVFNEESDITGSKAVQ